ncbi:hypothetical protein Glove_623g5 [Diversispora epigaea]|uniref:Uncharacterized protein n=1 Tax=Diversispora epigaea TaxID=1348612 RepID=A0A397GE83_9GLOM|nr:hypothetical protein Glove_623g5 [Diversispora epigaea]
MCHRHANTIVVAKVVGTDEIDNSTKSTQMKTKNSFIFSLKNGNIQNSILNRVKDQSGVLLYCNSES